MSMFQPAPPPQQQQAVDQSMPLPSFGAGDGLQQKSWERKFQDFHSTTIKFVKLDALEIKRGPPCNNTAGSDVESCKENGSMLGFRDPVSDPSGVCCKFVHAAASKNRCSVNVVEWLNNGRRLLTANHVGEFTMWNGTNFSFENMLQAHPGPVRALHWMPDGSALLSGDAVGVVKFWDQNFYPFVTFQAHKEPIRDLTSSPNGSKFATCADEAHAKIWDFRTGQEERLLKGHGWDIKTCQWHPSKALLVTGSKDCAIKLWDPRQDEAISTIYCHKSMVTRVRWSPDGQWLATGSRDQLVKVLDIRKMSPEDRVLKAHNKEVTALAWHPIDHSILTTGSYDGQLCFWDIKNSTSPIETLIGAHEAAVWTIAYHPLGNMMVTGSHDNSTKFWGRSKPGDGNPQDLLPRGKAFLIHQQQQAGGAVPGYSGMGRFY